MTEATCLIKQSNCGRIATEPICPICGLDERMRYIGEEAAALAKSHAEAKYWRNHAENVERAVLERRKAEEAKREAEKERQEVKARKDEAAKREAAERAELERRKADEAKRQAEKERQEVQARKAADAAKREAAERAELERRKAEESILYMRLAQYVEDSKKMVTLILSGAGILVFLSCLIFGVVGFYISFFSAMFLAYTFFYINKERFLIGIGKEIRNNIIYMNSSFEVSKLAIIGYEEVKIKGWIKEALDMKSSFKAHQLETIGYKNNKINGSALILNVNGKKLKCIRIDDIAKWKYFLLVK